MSECAGATVLACVHEREGQSARVRWCVQACIREHASSIRRACVRVRACECSYTLVHAGVGAMLANLEGACARTRTRVRECSLQLTLVHALVRAHAERCHTLVHADMHPSSVSEPARVCLFVSE